MFDFGCIPLGPVFDFFFLIFWSFGPAQSGYVWVSPIGLGLGLGSGLIVSKLFGPKPGPKPEFFAG